MTSSLRSRYLVLLSFLAIPLNAQRPPDMKLDAAINRQVIEGVIRAIDKYYVSAEVSKRMSERLRERLRKGEYDKVTSAYDLMDLVDAHLQEVSHDKHLALAYSHIAEPLQAGPDFPPETPRERDENLAEARASNFGVEKVERLDGNIGYLEMNRFVHPELAGESIGMAMSLLSNSDALIIDLRNSSGGSADMVAFLASYFFTAEPFHLGDSFIRAEDRVQQWWTFPYVPGDRFLDRPVYILLSKRSFSAVEGFASVLQHHKRSVIVGEATRGGTHAGKFVRVHSNFALFVPMSWFIYPTGEQRIPIDRTVYPTRRTDYEGTGVKPDIAVEAANALKRAHLEALNASVSRHPQRKERNDALIQELKRELGLADASK